MNIPLVVLIIMDGWGIAPPGPSNAIALTRTPNLDRFWQNYPHTQLLASGPAVGLTKLEPGNTETGHLNLGAGRIVYQDLPRIDMSINDSRFFKSEALSKAVEHVKKNRSNLHIMGLVSQGYVHSSINHLWAILSFCKQQQVDSLFLHAFTDGRDSPPDSGLATIMQLEKFMEKEGIGKIVSVMGRYWAMDRDHRWDRTQKAYLALTNGQARSTSSIKEAIQESHDNGVTDEFINPVILASSTPGEYLIKEGDAVIFFNFRSDRPRQLTKAFVLDDFENDALSEWEFEEVSEIPTKAVVKPFARGPKIKNLCFVTMTEYSKQINKYVLVISLPDVVVFPLGLAISKAGLRQLRLAESEKERFVTFYFNGQQDITFPREDRIIIPSPKVATYDQTPEMSARFIVDAFKKTIATEAYAFVLINFANPDMVGHTGNLEATKAACSTVDECVGEIVKALEGLGAVAIITADHGNAEELLTTAGMIETEHSSNPVPFFIVGKPYLGNSQFLQPGILADVAPTILKIMDIEKPSEMTGRPLI